jgi:hypothetical protein
MFRPTPTGPQALEGHAERFITDQARRHTLCHAHLSSQLYGPCATGLAKLPGRLVQDGPKLFPFSRGKYRFDCLGASGLLLQAGHPVGIEGANGVAHRLGGTSHLLGDEGWTLSSGTCQHNLAAAHHQRVPRTSAPLQVPALLRGHSPNKEW